MARAETAVHADIPSVSQQVTGIKPGTHRLAVQNATTEPTIPVYPHPQRLIIVIVLIAYFQIFQLEHEAKLKSFILNINPSAVG